MIRTKLSSYFSSIFYYTNKIQILQKILGLTSP